MHPTPTTPSAPVHVLALVLALVLTGCTLPSGGPSAGLPLAAEGATASDAGDDGGGGLAGRRFLRPSSSCDDLLGHYISSATELVGPWGLGGGGFGVAGFRDVLAMNVPAPGAAESSAVPATGTGTGAAFSGTNVQESGVDEADIVKTDGRIIVATTGGVLTVTDAAAGTVVGRVPLPADSWQSEVLLDGTTALVLSVGGSGSVGSIPIDGRDALLPAYGPTRTTVTRIDLADPAAPAVLGSVRMEGSYVSARMVDGVARVVLRAEPTGLAFTQPADGGLEAEEAALQANRALLAASGIDDWIPHLQQIGADGTVGEATRILECTDISQPAERAGLSTLAVLTFDLGTGGPLTPSSGAGLVAAGDTVYASADRLVVATSPWGGWVQPFIDRLTGPSTPPEDLHTDLHSFDISDPTATRYVASGRVTGTLVNSFALSESAGLLRVATTTRPDWFGDTSGRPSESALVVMAEQGESLVEVGRVDGLGLTEQIQSVRYLSPTLAAIVTFRQTDPLYLVDSTDPAAPRVVGELKVPGFSSYLHPVGEGYLLGIGQDADPDTGQTTGLQVSLFDIRDLANPQRVAQVGYGDGYSPVESDHRSFLLWSATGQVVVPAELYRYDEQTGIGEQFAGAVVLGVGPDGAITGTLADQGRITHLEDGAGPDRYSPPVQRSLVIGDDLWTLADTSLVRHDLASLAREVTVSLR